MDPLVILLIIVTSILTVLLVIVGVQVIMILKEVKQTLTHVNHTLEAADNVVALLSRPASGFADMVAGVKTGLRISESFVSWLNKNREDHHEKKSS